jgi:PAS domain S-box-containing protein
VTDDHDPEEKQRRTVALQNSQASLLARQRAEEDLVRAKDALELKTRELAKSLAAMRATLESTTDGILVTTDTGQVADYNEKFVAMWQLPPEVMEKRNHRSLIEITCQNFADASKFLGRIEEIYASAPPESYDLLELSDGRVVERFSRIPFVGDRSVGRVWSFRDITAHRRAEEQIRKQAELSRVTLTSIGDAVIATDADGNVLSMNTVAQSLTGWTENDARGLPLIDVFHIVNESSRKPVENPATRALREGRVVGLANHTILIARDGTETPIDDSAAPIRDDEGNVHGVVLIFRSIAEHKQAERALRESEQELSDFFENASVGLHWVGPDGTILRANRAELELLGYSAEEFLGRHVAEFHADPDVIAELLRRLSTGEVVRDFEARMRCRDGSVKHVLIDSSVLMQDGRFIRSRCFTRDNTDRKLAEEAQARLATIVETSQDAIISKTLGSRILSWNTGAERLFGYAADEIIGQSIAVLIPPDRQDEESLIMQRLTRGERIEHYETVRVTKHGRLIDISLSVSPIRDKSGQIIGASKIARDITARKQAEQALRASEERLRQLADAMPHMVWAARPDGFVDYYNERWYEFTGIDRNELGDESWRSVLHPDDAVIVAEGYSESIRTGTPYQQEVRVKEHSTGSYRWFLGRAIPVLDASGKEVPGRIVRWYGTLTDIHDTKQAELTTSFLSDASAALAEIMDDRSTLQKVASLAVPFFADWCAIDMLEPDGSVRRLAVNHIDPSKVALVQELSSRYPADSSSRHGVMEVLRTGRSDWMQTIPDSLIAELARDEEHLQVIRELGLKSYICTPLRSRGRTLGALTFVTAESGRIYNSNDLAAAEDLAHRAVIAIENANLLATLKEADVRKDEFLAMLAHELRNPLAPIRNAVHIFRGKCPPVPELNWATDVIDRQVEQMTRLVDDLLDVSRITRGKIELRKQRIELPRIVNNALEASRPLIEKCGHELIVTIPDQEISLEVDATRLTQVLLNLLNNSAKYMDPGGRIWLTAELESGQAVIRVKDTGIGIPPEMLSRIFEMFAQVDRSLDRSEGGLGIGLTLVKRLVEMHGGTVEAYSGGHGKGSEFVLRLPTVNAAAKELRPETEGVAAEPARPRRILVVDDNRDAAISLSMLLRIMGNEVHAVHDGLAAVEAALEFRPDMILLDIGLPKLNGYEAARRIRMEQGGRDIVMVAVTGWGQEEDRNRSKDAGFNHHMTKPVEFDALQKLLATISPINSAPGGHSSNQP